MIKLDRTNVSIEIPKHARFKAADVCSIAGVQLYVLRSWEGEFQSLGRLKGKSGSRVYRRAEIERVLEIKRLLYEDGLTLGAARRRLEGDEHGEANEEAVLPQEPLSLDERKRLSEIRKKLRGILELLSNNSAGERLFGVTKIEMPKLAQRKPKAKVKKARSARVPSAEARRKRRGM